MRTARLKFEEKTGVYHCISRSVAGAFLLDDEAKTIFRKILWEVAEFCGVEVLAYCLMTNHFHVLVRVSPQDVAGLTREEVLRRYAVLYTRSNTPEYPDASVLRPILEADDWRAQEWMDRLTARMNDVSEFMKTVKQRFTMWFNKRHKRFGTLWSERFKSVLVQNDPVVLQTVAAYIDLNPVRAGLAADPAAYAWCSYGEAMGGSACAQAGLGRMVRCEGWPETAERYRKTLFAKGGIRRAAEPGGAANGGDDAVGKANAEGGGGGIASAELLRKRQRAFTEGRIVGTESFVEEMRSLLPGTKAERTKRAGNEETAREAEEGAKSVVSGGGGAKASKILNQQRRPRTVMPSSAGAICSLCR